MKLVKAVKSQKVFEAVLGVGGAIASQFINSHKQKITAPQVTNYSVAQGQ